MARPHDLDQIGYLYFIESPEQDAVKVGFASDPDIRLKTLQTGNPHDLVLKAQVRATYGAECAFHAAMKRWRLRLEWYPSTELLWSIQNEAEDALLDLAMGWLLERYPVTADPSLFARALENVAIDGDAMTAIINEAMASA